MKKIISLTIVFICLLNTTSFGQLKFLKDIVEEVIEETTLDELNIEEVPFSVEEAANALKEALSKGIEKGVQKLNKEDGYFKNTLIKIPFPKEAEQISTTLAKVPGGKEKCDEVVLLINRSAELASKEALNIFIGAITAMEISDAIALVNGEEDAATQYLENTTKSELLIKFKPIIENALQQTGTTKYWGEVMKIYNKVPFTKKVNPDLAEYATEEATIGLFKMIAEEESAIRSNQANRTTALLEKVFGQ
ncbi:DUF4197 domain-containing protein [Cyclobacteriaceae bacterium]|nr:DUF4197 domain-containing protein [Cyclobacteriaceae bacterium]MDB4315178.1 DUF4197 domain-containing protein [Cyclobacteriaceae bacterium]MDB4742291.1 DUF4197 domain-containing protein [Cyclobacteriaceae bacterium]MDB9883972.1 DUF4197 domain-containing protein [Cyclobacteriaceae bacterium]MDC1369712.1 DUF4197 domain-containing protein [Cyclobacteriaceae bacterium]